MAIPRIPERFLRHVWQHQLYGQRSLATSDGVPLSVISAGIPNPDAGPDFTDAIVRIGGVMYRGDIELHVDGESWATHHHASDPHYNRVILHVVLRAGDGLSPAVTASRRAVPLLILAPFIDPELYSFWRRSSPDITPYPPPLPCRSLNAAVTADVIRSWLKVLSRERLELRIRSLDGRLRDLIDEERSVVRERLSRYHGNPDDIPSPAQMYTRGDYAKRALWEQLLYECVLQGLGYARNSKPFFALGRSLRLSFLRRYGLSDRTTTQAALFGAAGLLPRARTIPERESRTYVRILRRRWKELRPSLRVPMLNEADWLFFRLRPVNFPTARLACFCSFLPTLFSDDAFRTIIGLFSAEPSDPGAIRRGLVTLMRIVPDAYWLHHLHFRGRAGMEGIALGRERIDALLVNAFIPIVLLYARVFTNHAVRRGALALLNRLPAPRENAVTRVLRRDLFGGNVKLESAGEHQGALQLYAEYCMRGRCAACEVGKRCGMGEQGLAEESLLVTHPLPLP
ncbi:MAG: DUF2851 family protein [Bacteroidota bacterium]